MLKSYVNSTAERVEELSRLGQEKKKEKKDIWSKIRKRKERKMEEKMDGGGRRESHTSLFRSLPSSLLPSTSTAPMTSLVAFFAVFFHRIPCLSLWHLTHYAILLDEPFPCYLVSPTETGDVFHTVETGMHYTLTICISNALINRE